MDQMPQQQQNGQHPRESMAQLFSAHAGAIAKMFEAHGVGMNTPIAAPVIDDEENITGTENTTLALMMVKLLSYLENISFQVTVQTGIAYLQAGNITEDEALAAADNGGPDEYEDLQKHKRSRKR